MAKLDAIENKQAAAMHQIKGFPTIKYFRGGQYSSEYNSGRKESDIVAWALKKSGPAITTVTSLTDLQSFESTNKKVFVLGAFTSLESENAKKFAKVANSNELLNFAYSDAPEVLAKYEVSVDTAIIIKNFDDLRNDFVITDDVEELTAFIIGHSTPLGEVNQKFV